MRIQSIIFIRILNALVRYATFYSSNTIHQGEIGYMPNIRIMIDENTIKRWQMEIEEIDRDIKNLKEKKAMLQNRLSSVHYFIDDPSQLCLPMPPFEGQQGEEKPKEQGEVGGKQEPDAPFQKMGPPSAIRYLLRLEGRPVLHTEIKERLKNSGYPMQKLGKGGGYFYTVLKRMEKNGTIAREGDFIRLK
jgi:hypothetical protein